MNDRIAEIYDQIAPDWDRRQGVVERVLMGEGMRRSLAAALSGDVLEIGTGTGVTYPFIAERASLRSFTAVDLSRGMLQQAARREAARAAHRAGDVDIHLVQMDATHLGFRDAAFDTVTTSLTLCTVPDPTRALREMARVCKPGGSIVLLEHVLARNPVLAKLQRMLTPMQERHLGCHLDRQTDRLVRDLGFWIEREETRFFGVFCLIIVRI